MEILNFLVGFFTSYGYFAVFGVLILCGFGLPVPEDVTLIAGGVISGLGYTNVHIMFGVGMAGVLVGDGVVFSAGYFYGPKILEHNFVKRFVTPERYDSVQKQFEKYGKWVVFMGRFMPGLRMPIYLSAGISRKVSFSRFLITDGVAAFISVPIWIYMGYFFAHSFNDLSDYMHRTQAVIFGLLGAALLFIAYKYFKRRKNRA